MSEVIKLMKADGACWRCGTAHPRMDDICMGCLRRWENEQQIGELNITGEEIAKLAKIGRAMLAESPKRFQQRFQRAHLRGTDFENAVCCARLAIDRLLWAFRLIEKKEKAGLLEGLKTGEMAVFRIEKDDI